jgi:hypothetical protein
VKIEDLVVGIGVTVQDGVSSQVKDHELKESAAYKENARWLLENDPLRSVEGVRTEIERRLAGFGLTIGEIPFPKHKPTREQKAVRDSARLALRPMFDSGVNHTYMAEALGCSRSTLHKLLGGDNHKPVARPVTKTVVPNHKRKATSREIEECSRRLTPEELERFMARERERRPWSPWHRLGDDCWDPWAADAKSDTSPHK